MGNQLPRTVGAIVANTGAFGRFEGILSHLSFNLTVSKLYILQKKDKSSDKTCASILEKWGREIDEKENWYREAIRRRQSSFEKQGRADGAKAM